jgi:hypothetical protein
MSDGHDDFWEIAAAHRRFLKRKLCMAESSSDPCNSSIIQAHTIPRCQLKQIARKSHVYSGPSIEEILKSTEMPLLKETGIGKFSTLSCFCARHDKSIFADVEDIPLVFSPRQLALLHYRTVAGELYKKLGSSEASLHNIGTFSEGPQYPGSPDGVDFYKLFNRGEQIAIRDGRAALDDCVGVLSRNAYDSLSAMVIRFRRLPSVMTVGGFYPEFDFNGRHLQTLGRPEIRYETVSFNILASEDRAAVAMIWWKGHDSCLAFAKSYAEQRVDRYTTLAIQAAFEHIENLCVRPSWWESLKPIEQKLLTYRLIVAGGLSEERNSNCLQYTGVTHDDWQFDTLEFINV